MVPHKIGKKQDPFSEDPKPNLYIFLDIITRLTDVIKSWKQVYGILEQENSLHSHESSKGEYESTANKLREVAKSDLHKVTA